MYDLFTAMHMAAFAQSSCASFSCSEMNNIAIILDSGLLLGSIIILLISRRKPFRIMARSLFSLPLSY